MYKNSTDKLAEIANIFVDIQNYNRSLSFDERQIVYLFFVHHMTVSEISFVCEASSAKIHLLISDFLADLLFKCKKLQALLIRIASIDKSVENLHAFTEKWYKVDLIYKAHLLIENRRIKDSVEARIIELIGTALDVSTDTVPPDLHIKILSNILGLDLYACEQYVDRDVTYETKAQENIHRNQIGVSNRLVRAARPTSTVRPISTRAVNCFANLGMIPPDIPTCDTADRTAIIHRDGAIQTHTLTEEQVNNINAEDFDFFLDIVNHQTTIRLRNGKIIAYLGGTPPLGNKSLSLLFTLLSQPGEFLHFNESHRGTVSISTRSGCNSLCVRIALLRKSFREDAKKPWFFVTKKPYTVAFSRERSYCVVSSNHDRL